MIKQIILVVLYFEVIYAHMFIQNIEYKNNDKIIYAYPRNSSYDPFYINMRNKGLDLIDYDMMSPLSLNKPYPCRGYKRINDKNYKIPKIYAGNDIKVIFSKESNAFHNGGIKQQFSIAIEKNMYKNYTVIETFERNENLKIFNEFETTIYIPKNIPKGGAVLSWTWFSNHLGNNNIEYFMNCIDLEIINDNIDDFNNINNIIIPCGISQFNVSNICNFYFD